MPIDTAIGIVAVLIGFLFVEFTVKRKRRLGEYLGDRD